MRKQEVKRSGMERGGQSSMDIGEAIRDWYRERLKSFEQWPKAGFVSDLLSAAWSEMDWRELGEYWLADNEEGEEGEEVKEDETTE